MKGAKIRWFGPAYSGIGQSEIPGISHGEHTAIVETELMWGSKSLDVIRARVIDDGIYKDVKIFLHKKQVEIIP